MRRGVEGDDTGTTARHGANRPRRRLVAAVIGALLVAVAGLVLASTLLSRGTSDTAAVAVSLEPGRSSLTSIETGFSDGGVAATYRLRGTPRGGNVYLGVELRQGAKGLYRTKAVITPQGAVGLEVSKVIDGREVALGQASVPLWVPSEGATNLRVQGEVFGAAATTLRVRIWPEGGTAPDWQLTGVDSSSPVVGTGSSRAWAYLSSSATHEMDLQLAALAALPAAAVPVAPPSPAGLPADGDLGSGRLAGGTGAAPLDAALAAGGAVLPTRYSVPDGAIVVSPTGDDAAAGTVQAPLASLSAALARVPAGGTVVLRGGTYRQSAGSVNTPLTLQAYPGEIPVLSGADVVSDWTAEGGHWRTTSWRSPFGQNDFRAQEVPAGSAAGKVEQAYRNGAPLQQVLGRSELVPGTFWVNPSSRALYVADDPRGAVLELSSRTRGLTLDAAAAGSVIRGVRFTRYAAPHLDDGAELYVSAPRTTIEDSQFDHSSGAGLKLAASDVVVQRTTISDNAAEGLQGNRIHRAVIRRNQFLRNNTDRFTVEGCGDSCTIAGFKAAHTDDLTVADNAFVANAGNGFWCDLGCTDVVVTRNAISGGFDGIFYEVSSRGRIVGNYVEKAHKGIRVSGSDAVIVSGNVLVDNQSQLAVYDDRRSASSDGYAAALGLSWDTRGLQVIDNVLRGGPRTQRWLDSYATNQIASPQMFGAVSGNTLTGTQAFVWCSADRQCRSYASLTDWTALSGLGF
ncbi:MAG: right-handed parallel beta-helix repeat-containing protein [Kineosporiaceae bacterium]|nr:right-handed parallel beta-helix repeat-containing protein [Kineosporiaceae bacterium]